MGSETNTAVAVCVSDTARFDVQDEKVLKRIAW